MAWESCGHEMPGMRTYHVIMWAYILMNDDIGWCYWFNSVLYTNFYVSINHLILLYFGHNGRDSVSNRQPHDCLLNRLFRRRSKKTPKLRVTGLCVGNSPGTGEFPAQMASNAENVSIWWRHHLMLMFVWSFRCFQIGLSSCFLWYVFMYWR